MLDAFRDCIRDYGRAPRDISLWARLTYFRIPKPTWLRLDSSDRLSVLFRNARKLFEEGVVVWGHIIQANSLMFEKGSDNCPGEVVYALTKPKEGVPEYLPRVSHKIGSLKGTGPCEPELANIAQYLTDEMIRVYGLPVPEAISPKLRCRISTTFFFASISRIAGSVRRCCR